MSDYSAVELPPAVGPPEPLPESPPSRRRGVWIAVVAAAAVLVLGIPLVLYLALPGDSGQPAAGPGPTGSTGPTGAAPVSVQPTVSRPAPAPLPPASNGPQPTATSGPAAPVFRYLPLWPFGSVEDAVAWQQAASPGGHQPLRLDAGMTAQVFTQTYLGFGTVDRIVGATASGDEAWIQVGYRAANGNDMAAATVHLARIGAGDGRPWEVVGTRDVDLSLTTPGYGATVTSPVTVGGRISGVDESLTVQVRGLRDDAALGHVAGIAAGGQDAPWSTIVPFGTAAGTVRAIVVSSARHDATGVARFAVTGVRVPA